jgi:hypothetical protein
MTKQFDQEGNRWRTDLPDDFKSLLMQVFIVTSEESSQQGQRTPAALDQCGFGAGADLRVIRHHAIFPVTHKGGVAGNGLNYWFSGEGMIFQEIVTSSPHFNDSTRNMA